MTLRKRPSQILLLSLTIFALFVSAISACACSHHQTAAVEETVSCQSSAHGAPAIGSEQPVPSGDSLRVDCDCLVRLPIPAVSAKSEKKILKQSDEPDTLVDSKFDHLASFSIETAPVLSIDRLIHHHSPPELFSGPSRAPPRL